MRKDVAVALIGGASLIIGNLITVFGPRSFSYGFVPEFVMSPIYRDLVKENPKLEPTIKNQLLERELYYKDKSYEVVFEKIENEKVLINVKTKTKIRNSTAEDREYTHVAIFADDGTQYIGVRLIDHNGKAQYFSAEKIKEFNSEKISGGYRYTFKEAIKIPPKEEIDIESEYSIWRPVYFNELPLVTNRLVNSNVTYDIIDKTGDSKFSYDMSSLAFPENLPIVRSSDNSEATVTITGPLFTGQGISLIWKKS